MKKTLLLIPIAFAACNLEVSTPKAKAESRNISCKGGTGCITFESVIIDGITYHVFGSTHNYANSPFVVNYTKDSLEIELLKKNIFK